MDNKEKGILAFLVFILVSGTLYFFWHKGSKSGPVNTAPQETTTPQHHPYDFTGPCPGPDEKRKMTDGFMKGILEKDQEYTLATNWYWCNQLERNDLVLLKFAPGLDPVVRRAIGIPGDKFQVTFDKKNKNWNLKINGKLIMSEEKPYFFGAEMPPPLKLLEESRKGVLQNREFIMLSTFPPGDADSGRLGVVNLNDALGKVKP